MAERRPVLFPEGFVWGSATAAYQIEGAVREGGRGPSVWDTFSHTPGAVVGGDTGDVACDHYHRVGDDVALLAELGHRSYRFSVAWSRVQPEGRGAFNQEGLAFYHELVETLLAYGIEPCVTLFHWDLPQALEVRGGFRHRDTVGRFSDYAAFMARQLGDRVSMWATFNEPWCYAYLGHAAGVHAPGRRSGREAVAVAHHQLVAHGTALQAMRAERDDLRLGIVFNPSPIRSEGFPAANADALRRVDAIQNRWWFDATLAGRYPDDLMADFEDAFGPLDELIRPGDNGTIAQPLDWLGVNYYFDILLQSTGDGTTREMEAYPTVSGVAPSPVRTAHTDMGWPITPDGFTEQLVRIHSEYDQVPPIYVTENGAAYDDPVLAGTVDDKRRIEYLDLHLRALADAIDAGVDVRGYFVWSFLDNFEWACGFAKRFGVVHVDFDTLERTPKASARWYREVVARNGLTDSPH